MANPIWLTGMGQKTVNLGTVTEGAYFEYPLDAYDPNSGTVTFKFLAGTLPPGIRINPNGYIQGGPYLNTVDNKTTSYEFTVRASDQHGLISDKSFSMTVANVNPPLITPRVADLGEVFDGTYYSLQLYATELNPNAKLTWTISSGALPNGLSITDGGLISGFIYPLPVLGNGGVYGFNAAPFNEFSYENSPYYQFNTYKFTVKVYDGVNYDTFTYQLKVNVKGQYTADNDTNTIDDTYLKIDSDNIYAPIMLTPAGALPEVRSLSKFAYQFQAFSPSGNQLSFSLNSSLGAASFDQDGTQGFDTLGFDQSTLSLPPGITMDPTTGWLNGLIGAQIESVKTYQFQIYVFETLTPSRVSSAVTYTMNVLGDITNYITWITGSDLGTIDNGSISELSISAINNAGHPVKYELVGDGKLPQGLKLDREGLIVGRVAFEYFSLDGGTTTIDEQISNFDNKYTFTVQATNTDVTASSKKTFTITVNNFNKTPYENIYIKALPSVDQRRTFLSIVDNTDIFPEELIYRPSDPNFGRARDIRSLFLAGLNPTEVADYISAMSTNTYNKRIEFSNVKTAIAVDANFNTKYEVVYIELKDDAVYKGNSPANKTYDSIIEQYVYPNSFKNMSSVITTATGYENAGAIPSWMTSPQADKSTLGFTRAIVLAYTVPGASNLIAYRLGANGITFNDINFVLDRYDLDNSYSKNFNIAGSNFILGEETTFDRIQRPALGVATSVDFGVTGLAFNMIHGKTVSEINAMGGLDGVTNFANGNTLLFLQQENYPGETGLYDGWVNTGLVPGYSEYINSAVIPDGTAEFPTNPYLGQVTLYHNIYYMFTADYVNGLLVSTGWKVANLRANPWTINIDNNDNVTLTPLTFLRFYGTGTSRVQITGMIQPGDYVQVNHGKTQTDTIVYYSTALQAGQSVPSYVTTSSILAPANKITRFDGYGVRIVENRLTYEAPEQGDIWLKFPDTGPLL